MEDDDNIAEVILFDSDEELNAWIASKANVQALKQKYNPRKHRALVNTDTRQITIMKGKHAEERRSEQPEQLPQPGEAGGDGVHAAGEGSVRADGDSALGELPPAAREEPVKRSANQRSARVRRKNGSAAR
jgi:hypothetical protein